MVEFAIVQASLFIRGLPAREVPIECDILIAVEPTRGFTAPGCANKKEDEAVKSKIE